MREGETRDRVKLLVSCLPLSHPLVSCLLVSCLPLSHPLSVYRKAANTPGVKRFAPASSWVIQASTRGPR